jgi:glutaredoxin 3
MGKKIVVYTSAYCPYCERAKSLLRQKGLPFEEVRVADDDDAAWDELEKRSGMKTMPQIWAGDELIGGYTELAARDTQDGLASLK